MGWIEALFLEDPLDKSVAVKKRAAEGVVNQEKGLKREDYRGGGKIIRGDDATRVSQGDFGWLTVYCMQSSLSKSTSFSSDGRWGRFPWFW